MGEKKIEYKNKFNYLTFVFGKPNCKGESPNTTIFKAIKFSGHKSWTQVTNLIFLKNLIIQPT